MIILSGLFGFGMSIYLIAADSNDLWDLFLLITGLVGVPLAGVFAVGIFTRRTNTFGVLMGLILELFLLISLMVWVAVIHHSMYQLFRL